MKNTIKLALAAAVLASGFGVAGISSTPAQAQSYRYMSCGELWYARNQIYARNGYCFKTNRGLRTFGRNCFPPYGRLSRWEKREVNRIIRAERRRGCR